MYLPRHFTESDTATLRAFVGANDFAVLVVVREGRPEAAHLPMVLDAARGPHGTLLAHVARANPIWRAFDGKAEALAVFHGPHAYVSPTWYADGGAAAVPTWNYAAVHAYGAPRIVDDPSAAHAVLARLTALYEKGPGAWTMDDAAKTVDAMLPGIVAFEMPVERLEGKWKLSQNRTAEDRAGVMAALERSSDANAHATAALMRAREPR
jgi:transcriptional regulator